MSSKNKNKIKTCVVCGGKNANYIDNRCFKHRLTALEVSRFKQINSVYVTKKCNECNEEFLLLNWYKENTNRGQYCSIKCKNLGRSKNVVFVNCKWCNKIFKTYKCKIDDGRGKYCSRVCCSLAKTIQFAGSNNPHWHGIKVHLNRIRRSREGKTWIADIKKIGKCQICGATNNLQAHHIISLFSLFMMRTSGKLDYVYDPNDIFFHKKENGMLVCECCHQNIHPFISVLKKTKNDKII